MTHIRNRWSIPALLIGSFLLCGCPDGGAEDAGEAVDDAIEDTGDAIEDATDG